MAANLSIAQWVIRAFLTTAIFTFSLAANAEAAPPTPTVVAQAQAFITVEADDYSLIGVSVIMLPGDIVGEHRHFGPDLVMVFEGEVINRKQGKEQAIKVGESWLDLPGEMHAVINDGNVIAYLWASALLPMGDTTLMPTVQIPLNVEAGEYSLIGLVLDFAPGAEISEHIHSGHVISYVLEGEITVREKGASKQLKTYQSWNEVPDTAYSVTNTSQSTTRVATTMLFPKGAEETTFVSSPTAPATEPVVTTPSAVTPANVPNSNSQFMPVLLGVGLLLIILAAVFFVRRAT